jgi:branched-chain amino acid transport system permease protein
MTRALTTRQALERALAAAALVLAALGPLIFGTYFVSVILTQTLFLGIAAASLIFLSAYGGMVSLAQTALYGIGGFALGNAVTTGGSKGLNLGWNPWLGVLVGFAIATALGLVFGALASRSTGIYFLMITLTYAVIANLFFGQVTTLSGFGGISDIRTPSLIGDPDKHPNRLYYVCLIVALLVYALIRYVVRTPFGLALQGVRDDPVRMASLGYNVPLHRILGFGLGAFIASLAGVLFVWWNGHIDPATIRLDATLELLVIAVIGGLLRLEGAWIGAFAFVLIQNYVRTDDIPVIGGTFRTIVGAIFLVIVLVSPSGLTGLWERALRARLRHRDEGEPPIEVAAAGPGG